MAYVVRSKSGKVVGRYATRGEAEARVAQFARFGGSSRSPSSKKARRVARRADRLPNVVPAVYRHVGVPVGGELPSYADGGYPLVYYDKNGESFCGKCASDYRSFDPIEYADAYYEGPPEQCAECGKEIESAYGDPDAEDEESQESPRRNLWSHEVREHWHPSSGLFLRSAADIASGLLRAARGNVQKAMQRLNFYVNRAGKNLTSRDHGRLERAKHILHRHVGRSARSPQRAAIIRGAYESFEKARQVHDPKRFKRGGGYTPEENAAIARAAGLHKAPSNRARGKLELYEFKANPPDKLFAYYENDGRVGSRVKTWMGDELGRVMHRGKEAHKFNGGRTVAIRVLGINGVTYAGTCNLTGGTYCNLRRVAG